MQTDLEEAKAAEIAKLQNTIQSMHGKVEETTSLLSKEKEAAKKAIEEVSSIVKETPVAVEDTAKIESLSTEMDTIKVIITIV